MGNFFAKFTAVYNGDPIRILLLGLDSAGKTTILYRMKLNENVSPIPTCGFNVEQITISSGVHLKVWDVSRSLWKIYFDNVNGLLFVVDSTDRNRFAEARFELFRIFDDNRMQGVPLVVMANKQDLSHAASIAEISEALEINKLSARGYKWHIQSTSATTGDGLFESMQIIAKMAQEFS